MWFCSLAGCGLRNLDRQETSPVENLGKRPECCFLSRSRKGNNCQIHPVSYQEEPELEFIRFSPQLILAVVLLELRDSPGLKIELCFETCLGLWPSTSIFPSKFWK